MLRINGKVAKILSPGFSYNMMSKSNKLHRKWSGTIIAFLRGKVTGPKNYSTIIKSILGIGKPLTKLLYCLAIFHMQKKYNDAHNRLTHFLETRSL